MDETTLSVVGKRVKNVFGSEHSRKFRSKGANEIDLRTLKGNSINLTFTISNYDQLLGLMNFLNYAIARCIAGKV